MTRVHLRPVAEDDLPLLILIRQDRNANGAFTWRGFRPAAHVRRGFEEDGFLGSDEGLLMIAIREDDTAAGFVSWRGVAHGSPETSRCWNIGVWVRPECRGKGLGTEAQRLLCEYLFETTTVVRVEAETDVDNIAEQRALEKAGFTREGLLRLAGFRGGTWHDSVIYSRLRHDGT